ncbi:hypothetical protein CTEN210_14796 [Chaetoceros tenuissimus]|uniref:RanBP2-type domain-containing protein n=1 Tax=Chaetoceros tenuissimus TaxID=426638 RepID=A0AAD3D7P1_9STRA|nr:hypothetical protein CTEN210_14796 [Chaetoceros tenuissimus]
MQDAKRPTPPKASDDFYPPAKRARAERTSQLTPLKNHGQEMTGKKDEQKVDRKSTAFTVNQKENRWMNTSEGRNYLRDEKGRINHGSIKMYGNAIKLGLGASGLKENKRSKTALKELRDEKYNGVHFVFSKNDRTEGETEARNAIVSVALKKHKSEQVSKPAANVANTPNATAEVSLCHLLKKEDGSWQCSGCTTPNPKTASDCLSCEAPKPATVGFTFGAAEATTAQVDSDSTPIVSVALKKQSMSHQVPKAAANTSNDTAAVSLPPPSQGWGDLFKKEEGTWQCSGCTTPNPKTASNCLSCHAEAVDA